MGAQKSGKRRGNKPFTTQDDDFIREHYGRWSNRQIAASLGRGESGVRYRAKVLGLNRANGPGEEAAQKTVEVPVPKAASKVAKAVEGDRLGRLISLRDRMEDDITSESVPMMQRAGYFREYRALLKEIEELEAGDGEGSADKQTSPFAQAIKELAEQQREILGKSEDA